MGLFSFFQKSKSTPAETPLCQLTVDYGKEPELVYGADRVVKDVPAAEGVITITPDALQVIPMPRGVTYREFRDSHPEYRFADARVLNAIVMYIVSTGRIDADRKREILGDFAGQIHFLGTEFEATLRGVKVPLVAYLNWKTYQPALRNLCPMDNPINHTVNCCACVMAPDAGTLV